MKCPYCNEETTLVTNDYLDYCENHGVIEGETDNN